MTRTCCYDSNYRVTKAQQRQHKHIWMYSTFCDICDADFDTWLQEEKEQVAFNLICEDFNRMLCKMSIDEKKIDRKVLLEIHRNMKDLARARGYLKRYPFNQQEERIQ